MRILWTLFKVIVGLAIAIPIGIIVLGTMFSVVAVAIALAVLALKLACIGFVGYGAYRLVRHFIGSRPAPAPATRSLPGAEQQTDRYYEAAMRELDAELGPPPRG